MIEVMLEVIMIEVNQVVIMIEVVDTNLMKIITNIIGLDMIQIKRVNSIMITIMIDGRLTEMEISIKRIGILTAMTVKEKD